KVRAATPGACRGEPPPPSTARSRMRDREPLRESMWFWAVALVLVFGALLAGTYLYQRQGAEADAGAPQGVAAPPAAPVAATGQAAAPAPAARVAPEPEPPPEPLPPLDESDEEVLGFLSVFLGDDEVARLVVPE